MTWERLLAGMAVPHREAVLEWLTARRSGAATSAVADRLGPRAWWIVRDHFQKGTPLALPAEVADAYLGPPEPAGLHDCEDCGYGVPVGMGQGVLVDGRVKIIPGPCRFECCPLCGGRIGPNAYYQKQGRPGSSGRLESWWR